MSVMAPMRGQLKKDVWISFVYVLLATRLKSNSDDFRYSWRYTCFCHRVYTHIHFCIFIHIDSGLRHTKGLGGQQGLSGQAGLLVFTPRALNLNHKSW